MNLRGKQKQWEREFLERYQDENGDLRPPWAEFPTYTQGTIGWRMGSGEAFLMAWHPFIKALKGGQAGRLAYLRRHPPAPMNRAKTVQLVLDPKDRSHPDYADLLEQGLIASDIAYPTWLARQEGVCWPWEYAESPEVAARYRTRELWFWSRQVHALRSERKLELPAIPEAWGALSSALSTGEYQALDADSGLLLLAKMMAAGKVDGPWVIGAGLDSYSGSFEMDMSYADAYRSWMMSAFDDSPQTKRFIDWDVPNPWRAWLDERPALQGLPPSEDSYC